MSSSSNHKKIVSYIPLWCFHTLVSLLRDNERCFIKLNMDNDKKYRVDFSLDTYDVCKRLRVYTLHNSKKAVTAD